MNQDNDFKTVIYLGITECRKDEIQFFVQTEDQRVISCKASTNVPARKSFLESINIGIPIRVQADFENCSGVNVPVQAFLI